MRVPAKSALLLAAVLAAACSRLPEPAAYLAGKSVPLPEHDRVTVCHGYDCTFRTAVAFSAEEWRRVRRSFEPPAPDPASERADIARAIATIEQIVGKRIGTASDRGGIQFIAAGDATQQDCIDESTNTTSYLLLMQQDGLLRWHRVAKPASRGVFLDLRWYHQSAVIAERAGGREYVVDSWYGDNGEAPLVTTLTRWGTSYGRPRAE